MGLFRRTKTVDIFFVGCEGTDIDRGIYSFYIDVTNGEILKKTFVKSLANPMSMSITKQKFRRVMNITYRNGSGKASDGGIWQYSCMELQLGLMARVGYEGRTYVASLMNPENTYAYGLDYYNAEIVIIPILGSKIIRVSDTLKLTGKSIDPIKQTESHPTSMMFTPDQKKLIVTDMGGDEIIFFDIIEKGRLVKDEVNSIKSVPGSGPKKLLFTHDYKFAYVINEISSTIETYTFENNHLTKIDECLTYSKDEFDGENIPTDVLITDDDRYILVTNKGDDTVVAFERDEEGKLKRFDCIETDEGPVTMKLFRNRWLVVCSKQGGSIESFELKAGDKKGIIYETHFQFAVHGPVCMETGAENLRVVK